MPTLYRVRAHESDTERDLIDVASSSLRISTLRAESWASTYYGENGATWFRQAGTDRYIAGRFYEDGYRELGTCIISVEAYDDEAPEECESLG